MEVVIAIRYYRQGDLGVHGYHRGSTASGIRARAVLREAEQEGCDRKHISRNGGVPVLGTVHQQEHVGVPAGLQAPDREAGIVRRTDPVRGPVGRSTAHIHRRDGRQSPRTEERIGTDGPGDCINLKPAGRPA